MGGPGNIPTPADARPDPSANATVTWDGHIPFAGVAAASDDGIHPGDRAGRYELIERVAAGGMGSVWRARDEHHRVVAVKILTVPGPSDVTPDAEVPTEFRLLADLQHRGIVRVEDTGRIRTRDGVVRAWLAMEYVADARTLDHWIVEHQPDPVARLRLVLDVAEALEVAHAAGVIHLDLKPSNVLVDERGHVHLIDFGVACTVLGAPRRPTGHTPGYDAPEQVARPADQLDARADVWALGLMVEQVLTGRPPPRRARDAAIPAPLGRSRPDLRDSIPHLLPSLDRLVADCRAPVRTRRPANAGLVHESLGRIIASHGRPRLLGVFMRDHPRSWRVGLRLTTAGLAATAGFLVATVLLSLTLTPMLFYASMLPPPPGSAAARDAFSQVVVIPVTGAMRPRLPALPAQPGIDARRASPTAATALLDMRAWYAVAVDRLVDEGAAVIVLDIMFTAPAAGDSSARATARLAAAIRRAGDRGVVVILATPAVGGPDPINPEIASATPHRGHVYVTPGLGGYVVVDAAIVRGNRLLGSSLAFSTLIAVHGGDAATDVDLDPEGRPRIDPQSALATLAAAPTTLPFSGRRSLDPAQMAAGVGVADKDDTWLAAARPPSEAAYREATIELPDLLKGSDAAGPVGPRIAGRVALLHTPDLDLTKVAGPAQTGGGMHAVVIEDMLGGAVLQIPERPSVLLTLAAALLAALLAAVGDPRATTRRRRWGLFLAAGMTGAVVVIVSAVIASRVFGIFLYPLPGLAASFIAAAIVLRGPRCLGILARLGIRTHHPPASVTSESTS